MHGQMYVEVLTPREARHPFPLVLIHGAAQTATNWRCRQWDRRGTRTRYRQVEGLAQPFATTCTQRRPAFVSGCSSASLKTASRRGRAAQKSVF
jgi:hypothetical protein